MRVCGAVPVGLFFDQEKEPQKTPYEEHIQTFAQRQGHGRRGRVHRRFPAARRSGPGGARQVQEGRVALLALRAQMPEILFMFNGFKTG